MKRLLICLLTCPLALLVGCVPSLHAIYDDETLVFESALLGTWSTEDTELVWRFSQDEEKSYRLDHLDKEGKSGRFQAHLVRLGEHLLLDLLPIREEGDRAAFFEGHLIPAHTFMLIELGEGELALRIMDFDWLRKQLRDQPDLLKHEFVDDDVPVLTASTEALQQFVLAHVDGELFDDDVTKLRRAAE